MKTYRTINSTIPDEKFIDGSVQDLIYIKEPKKLTIASQMPKCLLERKKLFESIDVNYFEANDSIVIGSRDQTVEMTSDQFDAVSMALMLIRNPKAY